MGTTKGFQQAGFMDHYSYRDEITITATWNGVNLSTNLEILPLTETMLKWSISLQNPKQTKLQWQIQKEKYTHLKIKFNSLSFLSSPLCMQLTGCGWLMNPCSKAMPPLRPWAAESHQLTPASQLPFLPSSLSCGLLSGSFKITSSLFASRVIDS